MKGFRLLEEQEIDLNYSDCSPVIEAYGQEAISTDFAIINGSINKLRNSNYWRLEGYKNNTNIIDTNTDYSKDKTLGIRPVISIEDIDENKIKELGRNDNDIMEVEYGYYPQCSITNEMEQLLEACYNDMQSQNHPSLSKYNYPNRLNYYYSVNTDHSLTDKVNYQQYQTYYYEGRYFIRAHNYNKNDILLSNGKQYLKNNSQSIWIEILPVRWYIDEKNDTLICKNIIMSGIPYYSSNTFIFNNSIIKQYLDFIFKTELLQQWNYKKVKHEEKKETLLSNIIKRLFNKHLISSTNLEGDLQLIINATNEVLKERNLDKEETESIIYSLIEQIGLITKILNNNKNNLVINNLDMEEAITNIFLLNSLLASKYNVDIVKQLELDSKIKRLNR